MEDLLIGEVSMLGLGESDLRVAGISYKYKVFRILFHKKYRDLDQTLRGLV